MGCISLDEGRNDVRVSLLGSLVQGRVILLGVYVDLGVVFKQESNHRQVAEVRGYVDRTVARLGLALDVRPVFHEYRGDPDEVLLGAQVKCRETVLKKKFSLMFFRVFTSLSIRKFGFLQLNSGINKVVLGYFFFSFTFSFEPRCLIE